jgi:hypothetical protein
MVMSSTLLKWMMVIGLSHAVFVSNGLAQEPQQLSPRAFCQATGGTVSETGYRHLFTCCYESKQKCIFNNEQLRYSRRFSMTPDEQRLWMARESRGGDR